MAELAITHQNFFADNADSTVSAKVPGDDSVKDAESALILRIFADTANLLTQHILRVIASAFC